MFQTGIPACDALQEIAFSGNIIPQIWYQVFVKRELKHPKPHLLAINILADIVYWYRPREIRDEGSGAVVGYQKKFSGDLLQRSYAQITEQFGCSAGQAKDAIVFLEQMGVVRRELRTIETKGMTYSNVLFLALDVAQLKALTYPESDAPENPDTPLPKFHRRGTEISADPVPEFQQTYTENTIQEISTENSIHPSSAVDGQTDAVSEEKIIDEVITAGQIPYAYIEQPRKMQAAIRYLCEYDFFMQHPCEKTDLKTESRKDAFLLLVQSLCSMTCSRKSQQYCGDAVHARDVVDAINQTFHASGGMLSCALSALDDYCEALASTHIKNYGGYMKAVLWNALASYRVKEDVEYGFV